MQRSGIKNGDGGSSKGFRVLEEISNDQAWYAEDVTRAEQLSRNVLQLISDRHKEINSVSERLVSALSSGCKAPYGEEIKLSGRTFENRADLKAECRAILKRHPNNGDVLNPEDESMVRELLNFHPKGAQKANGCTSMAVGLHPVWGTRCLYVVRGKDGEREDFSYVRCCDHVPTTEIHCQKWICQTLCGVMRLHPTHVEPLARIIEEKFPRHNSVKHTIEKHRNWMLSLLQLSVSFSALTLFIINLLIRKMIELDMQIAKKEDEKTPLEYEDAAEDEVPQMAQILDAMMMLMFEFLQRCLPIGGFISTEERELVMLFMGIFEATVLPTHRSRCVQFLFFYIAGCRPNWTEDFLKRVLGITYSPQHPVPTRLIAAAYCASYAARARNAGVKFAFPTMTYMLNFAQEMQQDAEAHVAAGECTHTQVILFLQAVQAVCYILCFKVSAFAEDPETKGPLERLLGPWGSRHENSESFTLILESPIRPIKLINRNVANQFVKTTKRLFPSISTNCRHILRQAKARTKERYHTVETIAMESFFPFDPYRLRHSDIFVRSMYQQWVPEEESDEEDEESDVTEEAGGFEAESDGPGKRVLGHSEDESDADFAETLQAEERGFIPSVGPSPAFRPQAMSMDMSPMTPLMSVDPSDEVDNFSLPTPMLDDGSANSVLAQIMTSKAFHGS